MSRPRATANQLELSGLNQIQKERYKNYNMTAGVPITELTEIKPPKNLSKKAKDAWKLTVTSLLKMKSLSETDIVNLYAMFQCYDEMLKAESQIKSYDIVHPVCLTKDEINDRKTLNTWYMQTMKQFTQMSHQFGMTPVSRTQLPLTQDDSKKDADPLEQIIGS